MSVLIGVGYGAAFLLLWRVVVPRPPAIFARVQQWDRAEPGRGLAGAGSGRQGVRSKLGRRIVTLALRAEDRGVRWDRLRSDLAILGRTFDDLFARLATLSLVGFLAAFFGGLLLAPTGVGLGIAILVAVGFVVLLVWIELLNVRERANTRRRDLERHLASFLLLVTDAMSAGSGLPEALRYAGDVGESWEFRQIANTIAYGRDAGLSAGNALRRLGDEFAIDDLRTLGTSLEAAGVDGARIQRTLFSQADTLYRKHLAVEADRDNDDTEKVTLYQVIGVAAFVVYIGYPMLANVLEAL